MISQIRQNTNRVEFVKCFILDLVNKEAYEIKTADKIAEFLDIDSR